MQSIFNMDVDGDLVVTMLSELLNDEECHSIKPAFEVWECNKDDEDLKETLCILLDCERTKPPIEN